MEGAGVVFLDFFAGFTDSAFADESTWEAERFLWLGSQRIFFFLQASQALRMRMRWAWSRCSLVLQPREAWLVTSWPSRVMIFMPGRWEKSVVSGRRLAGRDDVFGVAGVEGWPEEEEAYVQSDMAGEGVGVTGTEKYLKLSPVRAEWSKNSRATAARFSWAEAGPGR